MKRLVLLMAFFCLSPAAALADAAQDVRDATARWVEAFNRKDSKAIVALYAPDAVFFGTSSPVLRDRPELVWDYFKALPDLGDATISVGESRVQLFGDVAVHTGYYTRSGVAQGRVTQNPARFTFVYAKRGGAWRIVNHHSSALP